MTLEQALESAETFSKGEWGRYVDNDDVATVKTLAKAVVELRDALKQCVAWSEAYPVDIFPQPTPEQVDVVCKTLGLRIDSISAMVLRNYTSRIGEIAREALSC